MSRTAATLPAKIKAADLVSLGVITRTFNREHIEEVLAETGKKSKRLRSLPAHVMMYYVIAMALFMEASCRAVLRYLLEGIRQLVGPEKMPNVAVKPNISEARSKLGWEPVKRLHDMLYVRLRLGKRRVRGIAIGIWCL